MKKTEENLQECKIILLGETQTGKTSIISRLIFDRFMYNEPSTLVASNVSKVIEYKEFGKIKLRLQIWDTAGQERFRSINKIFYKDASVAIFVYDITNEKSFKEIENYWYNQVKLLGDQHVRKYVFI